jgi:hypothetical protein
VSSAAARKPRLFLITAVAGALLLAHAEHGGSLVPAPVSGILPQAIAAVPVGGGGGGQQQWARGFLAALGEPGTQCNLNAVVAWQQAEGGGPGGDGASFNNLNTTLREPGSYAMNSAGVQVFTSYAQGLDANVTVARMPAYAGVRSALAAGNNAQAVADAVASSPWGTEPFEANC